MLSQSWCTSVLLVLFLRLFELFGLENILSSAILVSGVERGSGRWEIPDGSYTERQVDGALFCLSLCVCDVCVFAFLSLSL